jgi:hypothetical protein
VKKCQIRYESSFGLEMELEKRCFFAFIYHNLVQPCVFPIVAVLVPSSDLPFLVQNRIRLIDFYHTLCFS